MDLEKVLGNAHLGDAFSKYLDRTLLEKVLSKSKVEFLEVRPESASSAMRLKKT